MAGKGAKKRKERMGKQAQKMMLKYLLMRNDDRPELWLAEERNPLKKAGAKIMLWSL